MSKRPTKAKKLNQKEKAIWDSLRALKLAKEAMSKAETALIAQLPKQKESVSADDPTVATWNGRRLLLGGGSVPEK